METYLNFDTLSNILQFLNKNSSFNFLNIASFMLQYRQMIYDKYLFDDEKIMDREICRRIKKVTCETLKRIDNYASLVTLEIDNKNDSFDESLINLPPTIQSIVLNSNKFNRTLNELPKSLLSLKIVYSDPITKSKFNQSVDNLPDTLTSLYIDTDYFNQSLDYLPDGLQKLTINNNEHFNQPIDKLPKSLVSLGIRYCDEFNQSTNNLPENLQSLEISCCDNFNQQIDKLPPYLKSLKIMECESFNYTQSQDKFPKDLEVIMRR